MLGEVRITVLWRRTKNKNRTPNVKNNLNTNNLRKNVCFISKHFLEPSVISGNVLLVYQLSNWEKQQHISYISYSSAEADEYNRKVNKPEGSQMVFNCAYAGKCSVLLDLDIDFLLFARIFSRWDNIALAFIPSPWQVFLSFCKELLDCFCSFLSTVVLRAKVLLFLFTCSQLDRPLVFFVLFLTLSLKLL